MKTNKIKQKQIAGDLNVSQGAISLWFLGINTPKLKYANAMKKLYDIPTEIWDSRELFHSYILNNSERFGSIKVLKEPKPK